MAVLASNDSRVQPTGPALQSPCPGAGGDVAVAAGAVAAVAPKVPWLDFKLLCLPFLGVGGLG